MNDKQKFELTVQYLTELLGARKAPNAPPELMDDPAFLRLDEMIRTLREGIFSLGRGDLSGQIREKGPCRRRNQAVAGIAAPSGLAEPRDRRGRF